MASPGNQHCANCIGTLSFPITLHRKLINFGKVNYYTYTCKNKL